jgi:hypothetical protein
METEPLVVAEIQDLHPSEFASNGFSPGKCEISHLQDADERSRMDFGPVWTREVNVVR